VSQRDIASLACKILGIYIFIQGINVLSSVLSVSLTTKNEIGYEIIFNIIFSLVYILVGVLLWMIADKLSIIMVRRENHSNEASGISANDLQRVSFSVLGLYFIGNSLPRLVATLTNMYGLKMGGTPISTPRLILEAGAPITEFIVGFGILLGSQGLANLLKTIRIMGLKREEEIEENE